VCGPRVRCRQLFSELADLYRSTGRYDEAIDAWEHALAAGDRSVPHPRAHIAELLPASGRRGEADALCSQLREQCPNDV
jgi:tetratricopeptide (TPR) repeat protein